MLLHPINAIHIEGENLSSLLFNEGKEKLEALSSRVLTHERLLDSTEGKAKMPESFIGEIAISTGKVKTKRDSLLTP